jgi:hypothetical protein
MFQGRARACSRRTIRRSRQRLQSVRLTTHAASVRTCAQFSTTTSHEPPDGNTESPRSGRGSASIVSLVAWPNDPINEHREYGEHGDGENNVLPVNPEVPHIRDHAPDSPTPQPVPQVGGYLPARDLPAGVRMLQMRSCRNFPV